VIGGCILIDARNRIFALLKGIGMGDSAEFQAIEILLKRILARWRAGIEAERNEWQETVAVSAERFSQGTTVTRPSALKPSAEEGELEGTIILRPGEGRGKRVPLERTPGAATTESEMASAPAGKPSAEEEELEGTIILRPNRSQGRRKDVERR
jgi:hypothetical protein